MGSGELTSTLLGGLMGTLMFLAFMWLLDRRGV